MKKHLVSALVALAVTGLAACSHDKTKDENAQSSSLGATATSSESMTSAEPAKPEVAAVETAPTASTDTSSQQSRDYERTQRK